MKDMVFGFNLAFVARSIFAQVQLQVFQCYKALYIHNNVKYNSKAYFPNTYILASCCSVLASNNALKPSKFFSRIISVG